MSIAEVKENIVNLLENIIKRSETIERQNGSRNLLEIDLAMEDIRLLYREMDLLRKFTEAEGLTGSIHRRGRNLSTAEDKAPASEKNAAEHIPHSEQPSTPNDIPSTPPAREPIERPVENKRDRQPEPPQAQTPPAPKEIRQENRHEPRAERPEEKPLTPQYSPQEPPRDTSSNHHKQARQEVPITRDIPSQPAAPRGRENMGQPVHETFEQRKPLVGEQFNVEKSSVHERLAQIRDDKSIGMRMQYKPVTNIKEAIGLNEKFLFINELFSGDINAYNSAVNELNSCASIHEAFELLNRFTEEFKWDGQRSAETIEKFANLVQRRYMQ